DTKFADRDIEQYWLGSRSPRRVLPDIRKRLVRKLQMLDAAGELADQRAPPSNHLDKLPGDRAGTAASESPISGDWSSPGKEAKQEMSSSPTITEDLSTPGEILLEEFLQPYGVSQYELAKRIGVDQARISRIVRGQQAITAATAL